MKTEQEKRKNKGSRFVKGISGNPAGRPIGSRNKTTFRTPDIPPSNPWKLHVFEDMGADQNLSAFSDRQNANRRRNRAVLLAATHSAAESRTEVSAPSPAHGCGPKPVRFFGSAEC
jgi:hypothetical protein